VDGSDRDHHGGGRYVYIREGRSAVKGSNTYIILHDDKYEFTYIDDEDDTQTGTLHGEWISLFDQMEDAKNYLIRNIGPSVCDSELRFDDQRSDRHEW
jgi:hypothetical protein